MKIPNHRSGCTWLLGCLMNEALTVFTEFLFTVGLYLRNCLYLGQGGLIDRNVLPSPTSCMISLSKLQPV